MKDFDLQLPLAVQWDGKLFPDISDIEKVDRLPVLVSGNGQVQLLAKLPSTTEAAQAQAVFDVLQKINLDKKVEAMCFNTTSSNTGCHKGACVILEQLLGQDLLHIGCHYYILEILAKTAFQEIMGS